MRRSFPASTRDMIHRAQLCSAIPGRELQCGFDAKREIGARNLGIIPSPQDEVAIAPVHFQSEGSLYEVRGSVLSVRVVVRGSDGA